MSDQQYLADLQEEVRKGRDHGTSDHPHRAQAQGAQEHRRRRGACELDLQQHQGADLGRSGQRDCLVVGRHHGLQGLAQIDPLCRTDGRRRRGQEGTGTRRQDQ